MDNETKTYKVTYTISKEYVVEVDLDANMTKDEVYDYLDNEADELLWNIPPEDFSTVIEDINIQEVTARI